MKRSHMINQIVYLLKDGIEDGLELQDLAEEILEMQEAEGVLPPPITKAAKVYVESTVGFKWEEE